MDLLVLVQEAPRPFIERARDFDATELPVPADVLVYSEDEWSRGQDGGGLNPVVWIRS